MLCCLQKPSLSTRPPNTLLSHPMNESGSCELDLADGEAILLQAACSDRATAETRSVDDKYFHACFMQATNIFECERATSRKMPSALTLSRGRLMQTWGKFTIDECSHCTAPGGWGSVRIYMVGISMVFVFGIGMFVFSVLKKHHSVSLIIYETSASSFSSWRSIAMSASSFTSSGTVVASMAFAFLVASFRWCEV